MGDVKRKHIRFTSDDNPFVALDLSLEDNFNAEFKGLAINESHKGASVVTHIDKRLVKGIEVRIKVGFQAPLRARIAWRKDLDEEVIRLGLEIVE